MHESELHTVERLGSGEEPFDLAEAELELIRLGQEIHDIGLQLNESNVCPPEGLRYDVQAWREWTVRAHRALRNKQKRLADLKIAVKTERAKRAMGTRARTAEKRAAKLAQHRALGLEPSEGFALTDLPDETLLREYHKQSAIVAYLQQNFVVEKEKLREIHDERMRRKTAVISAD